MKAHESSAYFHSYAFAARRVRPPGAVSGSGVVEHQLKFKFEFTISSSTWTSKQKSNEG